MTDQKKPAKPLLSIGEGLYESAPKSYPRVVKGRHRSIKTGLTSILLVVTALLPWIRWDRGPDMPSQAILFSFPDMRAYLFDAIIWAQQFYLLTGILIIACLVLFLATALFGRIWCGFACPQTVWTDLFVWIEKLTEGDRNARIRLDKAPWSLNKLARKTAKHVLWLVVSALTGSIFVFYFTDAVKATHDMLTGEASLTIYGFWGGFVGMTYLMAGFTREQMCNYMCPWPRIQGGMLDELSLIVSYDQARGESRAHAKIGQSFDNRGHCVDCSICVQVCPVGIDIRNGPQMDCINCGLCVDGCNSVMERFGLPPNLIGWRALSAEKPKADGKKATHLLLRPRTLIYLGLIVVVSTATLAAATLRSTLDLAVLPDRAPTFVRLSDGSIRDGYTVRVINRAHDAMEATLSVTGLDGLEISVIGDEGESTSHHLQVRPDGVDTFRVFVRQKPEAVVLGNHPVMFNVQDQGSSRHAATRGSFINGTAD